MAVFNRIFLLEYNFCVQLKLRAEVCLRQCLAYFTLKFWEMFFGL